MAKVWTKARYRTCRYNGKHMPLHRVIYQEAHGPIPDNWDVHHIDGNSLNNELRNLQAMPHGEHKILEWSRYPFYHLSTTNKAEYDHLRMKANWEHIKIVHNAYMKKRREAIGHS